MEPISSAASFTQINVDADKVEKLVEDLQANEQKRIQYFLNYWYGYNQTIINAINTYYAKVILNFGNTVLPIYERYVDYLKFYTVDDSCNIDAASQCFNFFADDVVNQTCLADFGCEFLIDTANYSDVRAAEKAIKNAINNTH
jgi:hypothetical protein